MLLLTCSCVFAIAVMSAADQQLAVESKIRGAYFGAVVADALTLGTHYEYDAQRIKAYYGEIDRFYAPGEKTGGETHGVGWGARNYHGGNGRGPAKKAGENTDYGDYNLLILEHLVAMQKAKGVPSLIDVEEFIPLWQDRMKTWTAWMDTMTKLTLQQIQQGYPLSQLGGGSNAMAIRHAAAYAFFDKEDDVVHTARTAMFTHRETTALDGGEFFGRVTHRIIHQLLTPRQAIVAVAAESSSFIKRKVQQALEKVAEATDPNNALYKEEFVDDLALTSMARLWDVGKTEPIKVGKASPTEGTLPGSIYFIIKYSEGNYKNGYAAAIRSNAEVGGDNASRSIAIGMVLGAAQGIEAIPEQWGPGHFVEWEKSSKLLNSGAMLQAKTQRSSSEL
eukprot:m.13523 g.13523  ORF g.13523 m.13523 type:complete len:392 (+) comp9754_c0_seq1:169-1344(+)